MARGGYIRVDPGALQRESVRLFKVADDIGKTVKGIRAALNLSGLPGYAKGGRAATDDVVQNAASLWTIASMLRARALLARLAADPGMAGFAMQLAQFERTRPDAF